MTDSELPEAKEPDEPWKGPGTLMTAILASLDENECPYESHPEHKSVSFRIPHTHTIYHFYVFANDETGVVCLSARPEHFVPEERRPTIYEFLALINSMLVVGNLEMNFDCYDVRYRVGYDMSNGIFTESMFESMVQDALTVWNNHFLSYMQVLYCGAEPGDVARRPGEE